MEETTEIPSTDYMKGFNEGYTIAKHMPELAAALSKVNDKSERGIGLQHGIQELQKEKEKIPTLGFLQKDRLNSKINDSLKDKQKDKDDLEIEK